MGEAHGQLLERSRGEDHAPEGNGERAQARCPSDEGKGEAEKTQGKPQARRHHEKGGPSIHSPREHGIARESFVLALVPTLRRLLREAGTVAHHPLDELVAHREPLVRPPSPLAVVAETDDSEENEEPDEQEPVQKTPRARGEHGERDDELD